MAATDPPPTFALADQHRSLHSPGWYADNKDAGGSRRAWARYLCIDETVAEGLENQVRNILKASGLHLAFLQSTEARDQVDEQIGTKIAELRPDLCCPGLPYDAFLRTIRKMVIRINSDDRIQARDQQAKSNEINRSTRKRPRTVSTLSSAVDPKPVDVVSSSGPLDQVIVSGAAPIEGSRKDPPRKIPAATSFSQEPKAIQHKPPFAFDTDLIGVVVRDPENSGQVHISYLQDLAEHSVDIRSCRGLKLGRLYGQMRESEEFSGQVFFDPKKDVLWCKIDEEEYNVVSPSAFEFICRWQIAAALKRDPANPPVVKFERRTRKIGRPVSRTSSSENVSHNNSQGALPLSTSVN